MILIDARGRYVAGFQGAGTPGPVERAEAPAPRAVTLLAGTTDDSPAERDLLTAGTAFATWIRAAEHAEPHEQWALLCFLAGRGVTIDEHELNAALRRSRAAARGRRRPTPTARALRPGGDGARRGSRRPGLRAQLAAGLVALTPELEGLRGAAEALRLLARDPDLAWQCYAMALLAEELADEE